MDEPNEFRKFLKEEGRTWLIFGIIAVIYFFARPHIYDALSQFVP